MSESRGIWSLPAAQELLVHHAEQHVESGLFDIYSRHLATLAILVKQHTGAPEKTSADNFDDLSNEIRQWSRAEVPLVPYYRTRGYLCGLWIGRLDEATGVIFNRSQVIVASMSDPEFDTNDTVELSADVTSDHFGMLTNQINELDGLGLKPRFSED